LLRKSFVVLLTMFLFALVACTSVDDATFDHYAEEAEQVILMLNDGEYGEVVNLFADELKTELDEAGLRQIEPLIAESGAFESIKKVNVDKTEEISTKEEIFVTVTQVVYENNNRTFTISFNDQDELVGLYVK